MELVGQRKHLLNFRFCKYLDTRTVFGRMINKAANNYLGLYNIRKDSVTHIYPVKCGSLWV